MWLGSHVSKFALQASGCIYQSSRVYVLWKKVVSSRHWWFHTGLVFIPKICYHTFHTIFVLWNFRLVQIWQVSESYSDGSLRFFHNDLLPARFFFLWSWFFMKFLTKNRKVKLWNSKAPNFWYLINISENMRSIKNFRKKNL